MQIFETLQKKLGDRVKKDLILAPYTTFKMGGPAEYYYMAETVEDMVNAVKAANELSIPFTIIGGASNIVISDKGISGLVIRNMITAKEVIEETKDFIFFKVGAGYSMTRLAKETADLGYSGIEYHLGLPGTVGGAVIMNSKWTHPKAYVGDYVDSIELISNGEIISKTNKELDFKYGYSNLQETKEIVLTVTFKLLKKDINETQKNASDSLAYRKETQPFGVATSGCFFKNAEEQSAGYLIDKSGLKGYTYKGYQVSEKHANFIVNMGATNTRDLKELLSIIKRSVKEKFNIELKEEVIII